jgi:hypothetical protein
MLAERVAFLGEAEILYLPCAPRPGLACLWVSRRHKPLPVQLGELARVHGVGTLLVVVRLLSGFRDLLNLVDRYRPQVVVPIVRSDWVLRLTEARGVEVLAPKFRTVYRGFEPPETWDRERDWVEGVVEWKWRKGKRVRERVYYVKRFTSFVPVKPENHRLKAIE